jgi:hypothetical protein
MEREMTSCMVCVCDLYGEGGGRGTSRECRDCIYVDRDKRMMHIWKVIQSYFID